MPEPSGSSLRDRRRALIEATVPVLRSLREGKLCADNGGVAYFWAPVEITRRGVSLSRALRSCNSVALLVKPSLFSRSLQLLYVDFFWLSLS